MLSICIPYHSGLRFLRSCLESIVASPPAADYEVLVIEDASPEPVGRRFPGVRLLINDANLGFGVSANRAFAACRGDQILLLNPDTRVLPGAIARLQERLSQDDDLAAVGPMVLNEDGTFQPQCKRGRLTPLSALGYGLKLDRLAPRGSALADYLRPSEPHDRPAEVEALSGSCMLVARRALEQVGTFDRSLFLYGEDLDLCYRFRDAGWRVGYEPRARIVHVGGEGGTSVRYFRSLYHYHRSAYVVVKRNGGGRFLLYGWLFALAFAVRFALHAGSRVLGRRRVGTAKRRGVPTTSRAQGDAA